jgi:hypothetical protein
LKKFIHVTWRPEEEEGERRRKVVERRGRVERRRKVVERRRKVERKLPRAARCALCVSICK